MIIASASGSTSTTVWAILGYIAAAGAVGGFVNALMSTDKGFSWPAERGDVFNAGVLGNIVIGAFAAVVTWGLYGPLKDAVIVGSAPPGHVTATLTVTALVGAALAGAGGSKIITAAIDKKYLREAAVSAAGKTKNPKLAADLASLAPKAAADAANAAES